MAKTTTTPTVHNPTNFEPSDYEVEDYLDNHRPTYYGQSLPEWELEIADWEADMLRTFGDNWRTKIHHCIHCGNGSVRWITAVRHIPTNEVVTFGAVCTNRLGFADKHAFKLAQLQAKADARKIRFTIYNKRKEYLAAHPEIADVLAHIDEPVHTRNTFVKDVLSKLDRYGDLSDNQAKAIVASMRRDVEYAAKQAAEAVEPKGEAPSGRVVVTGEVLSIKSQESMYGYTMKMLVKLTNNAKVWVTVPSGSDINRGDTVTVKATWEVSRDDKSFAFGKRPTLISNVKPVLEAVTV